MHWVVGGRTRFGALLFMGGCLAAAMTMPMVALAHGWSGVARHHSADDAGPPITRLGDAPWETNVRVNDDAGLTCQAYPRIAVDPMGNAYGVWMDARNGGFSNWDIYFSYRPAGGAWGPNVRVNDDVGGVNQGWPHIAVDPRGDAYAVWAEFPASFSDPHIYFAYRPAGGSWSSDMRVDDGPGTARQWDPSIAVDSVGNAYAVWEDDRNGISDIYFAYRPAGGYWGANVRVNDDERPVDQWSASIAVDANGDAYAVWADHRGPYVGADIYFSHRPAGGAWGPNERVNDDTGNVVAPSPSIAVDSDGNAYVAWADCVGGVWSAYFAYRAHDGTWEPNEKISDAPLIESQGHASIALDPHGNAYAAWEDGRNGHRDIYFAYRPAGGYWGANVRVNDDAGTAWQVDASIAVDSQGDAYTLWRDQRTGENDIYSDIYFSYRQRQVLWLGGVVWDDADRNGVRDAGEPGVPSVVASLYGNGSCTGPSLWADTTDVNGEYLFSNVSGGTVCVEFTDIPSGWAITSQDQGTDDTVDSDADPARGQIRDLLVAGDDFDLDLGLYMLDEFVPESGALPLLVSGLATLVGYANLRWRRAGRETSRE